MGFAHRLEVNQRIRLEDFDPGDDAGLKRKKAEHKTERLIEELVELQELRTSRGARADAASFR